MKEFLKSIKFYHFEKLAAIVVIIYFAATFLSLLFGILLYPVVEIYQNKGWDGISRLALHAFIVCIIIVLIVDILFWAVKKL